MYRKKLNLNQIKLEIDKLIKYKKPLLLSQDNINKELLELKSESIDKFKEILNNSKDSGLYLEYDGYSKSLEEITIDEYSSDKNEILTKIAEENKEALVMEALIINGPSGTYHGRNLYGEAELRILPTGNFYIKSETRSPFNGTWEQSQGRASGTGRFSDGSRFNWEMYSDGRISWSGTTYTHELAR